MHQGWIQGESLSLWVWCVGVRVEDELVVLGRGRLKKKEELGRTDTKSAPDHRPHSARCSFFPKKTKTRQSPAEIRDLRFTKTERREIPRRRARACPVARRRKEGAKDVLEDRGACGGAGATSPDGGGAQLDRPVEPFSNGTFPNLMNRSRKEVD